MLPTIPFIPAVAGFVRPINNGDGLRLYGAGSGSVGLAPASAAGSTDYTLPSAPPAVNGYAMLCSTLGVMSWGAAGVSVHSGLTGLSADDHTQYSLASGTRAFSGVVSGVTPTLAAHLATKGYVDAGDVPRGQAILQGAW